MKVFCAVILGAPLYLEDIQGEWTYSSFVVYRDVPILIQQPPEVKTVVIRDDQPRPTLQQPVVVDQQQQQPKTKRLVRKELLIAYKIEGIESPKPQRGVTEQELIQNIAKLIQEAEIDAQKLILSETHHVPLL